MVAIIALQLETAVVVLLLIAPFVCLHQILVAQPMLIPPPKPMLRRSKMASPTKRRKMLLSLKSRSSRMALSLTMTTT